MAKQYSLQEMMEILFIIVHVKPLRVLWFMSSMIIRVEYTNTKNGAKEKGYCDTCR